MAFKPTITQQQAIDASSGTLVSAAAGSGKTAVLAERVVRLLTGENPISADRILVVTFMSAAAEEMRSRIEKRLNAECINDPKNKFLYAQKLKIRNAKICTIDSFCIELIRENFDALGISPDFKIGDDASVQKTREYALSKVLNREFEQNSPEFSALLNALCSRFDETDLKDAITEIYSFSQNLPFPKIWLKTLCEQLEGDDFSAQIISDALSKISDTLKSSIFKTEKAISGIKSYEKLDEVLAPVLGDDLNILKGLLSLSDNSEWDKLFITLEALSFKRWPVLKGCKSHLLTAAKELRASTKADIAYLKKLAYSNYSTVTADIRSSLTLVKKLLKLVIGYTDEFTAACLKENIMTFSQAEHYALNLLCDNVNGEIVLAETAADIIGRFDEVLVDEFQDINDMQDLLFNIISKNEENLFAVGDVKQSIYGFRGSNPDNFLRKKNLYLPFSEAGDCDLKKIILGNNFRSRGGICEYINYLFGMLMNGKKSSIRYNSEEILVPTASFPENGDTETVIHFIDITDADKSSTEAEAIYIAELIKDYINTKTVTDEQDGNTVQRKPCYGDFALILRGVKSKGGIYADALKNCGIPVDFSAETVYDSSEVKIMLSLLTIIENPTRDIELVSVLMSPIFDFSADELAGFKANFREGSFISAVTNAAVNGNTKAEGFLKSLNSYRTASVTMGIGELVDYLYESTDLPVIVSALENGKDRYNNLMSLYGAAVEFQDNSPSNNVMAFVDYIRKQSYTDISKPQFAKENSVKITTIHKSKGLQYPVCFLADTSKRFAGEDSRKNLLTDSRLGVGFKYFDITSNEKKESLHFKIIKEQMLCSSYEEEMRLAYVAMTRAKEKLFIINSAKNLTEKLSAAAAVSSLCTDVTEYRSFIESSASYFDWLVYTSVIHPDFKLCEFESRLIADTGCKVEFKFINANFLNSIELSESDDTMGEPDTELSERIRKNLEYSYPFRGVKSIETKSSVAVVSHKADERDYSFTALPDFLSASGLSAAKRGTATHRFMQFADFVAAEHSVPDELDRLYEWEFITEAEKNAVDVNAVQRFFTSDIYGRIKNSVRFEREMRFITELPAWRLDATLPENVKDEPVIIQGSVDLAFVEPDGIVILDFKTDRVRDEQLLRQTYSEQLNIYGRACEKIFEKPIKELLLYSFSLSKTVSVPKK